MCSAGDEEYELSGNVTISAPEPLLQEREALKRELKAELKAELRTELLAELQGLGQTGERLPAQSSI